MKFRDQRPLNLAASLALAALATACSSPPPPTPVPPPTPLQTTPPVPMAPMGPASQAQNVRDYRLEAAYHLYNKNSPRVYKGVMPHFLYAIGVVELHVDLRGNLQSIQWLRAPDHAPEVMAEIERTVQQASPFPAPVLLGSTTFIETWLWDTSGRFQLHTLSEGQGPRGTRSRPMPAPPAFMHVVAADPAAAATVPGH
jgi:periplasmic protein TonB